MTFDTLIVARDGAVAVVTINRPAVLNALNAQTIDDLRRAVLELRRDEEVRAVVVTGRIIPTDWPLFHRQMRELFSGSTVCLR